MRPTKRLTPLPPLLHKRGGEGNTLSMTMERVAAAGGGVRRGGVKRGGVRGLGGVRGSGMPCEALRVTPQTSGMPCEALQVLPPVLGDAM
jgi:hypothetical protein